jgi:hypothetical protein
MKVGIFNPDESNFKRIYQRVCQQMGIFFDEGSYEHLIEKWYLNDKRQFQAVHPRDLLTIAKALCDYEEKEVHLTPELIDEACEIYFVKH